MVSASAKVKYTVNTATFGSIAVSVLVGFSMMNLVGMVRSMQLIIISCLVKVPLPAHAVIFFKECMKFAQMDVLDGQSFYEKWFVFLDTSPVN